MKRGHNPAFLNYLIKAIRQSGQFESLSSFATIPNVSSDKLARVRFAMPSEAEQQEIARFLDHTTSRLELLAARVTKMMEVLKERRQALISAAVTGKIDVRNA